MIETECLDLTLQWLLLSFKSIKWPLVKISFNYFLFLMAVRAPRLQSTKLLTLSRWFDLNQLL